MRDGHVGIVYLYRHHANGGVVMARFFNDASSQYVENTSPTVTGPPFTMACFYLSDDSTVSQTLMSLANSATTNQFYWMVIVATSKVIRGQAVTGAGAGNADTSAGGNINVVNHAAYREEDTSASRASFLNGSSKGTNTDSRSPTGINRYSVGRLAISSPSNYHSGMIAWPAIWNVALTDGEIAALAKGAHPREVRGSNLIDFRPFGIASPEIEATRNSPPMTVVGAKPWPDPPVLARRPVPAWRRRIFDVPAAGGIGTDEMMSSMNEMAIGPVSAGRIQAVPYF